MNAHPGLITAAPSFDHDDVISLQDLIFEAKMMADVAAAMTCEAFDEPHEKDGSFGVYKARAERILFCVSETVRRLKIIETTYETTVAAKI